MIEWQPMATAPNDETFILLWFERPVGLFETHCTIGFWSDEGGGWFASEAASASLTAFGDEPIFWAPINGPGFEG